MLLEIILSLVIGILFGTFTGLIPGIHINLVGISVVSLSTTLFLKLNPLYLVIFIVAMSITHTFVDFIPSIFLGCPDTDTELSILPGHELLKKGQGYEAVLLSVYGSLFAITVLLIIAYPSTIIFPKIFEVTKNSMAWILVGISGFLILIEKNKIMSLIIFMLSGFLGYLVTNIQNLNQPLFPLLTGLFGSSILITSIKNKTEIPQQKIEKVSFRLRKFFKPLISSLISSPLCSFLPGLGSGQAAIIGNSISKNDKKGFIVLLGATNTLVMGFSFITLYLLSKTRTGSALAIQQIIGNINSNILILVLIIIFIAGTISFFLTDKLAKIFSKKISKFNYTKISITTLSILIILTLVISSFMGLIILVTSTLLGIYCISTRTRRTLMMGCLLVPTILFYLSL